ncbi:MAG: YraN family protein [Actinobacteria bacterium HGW-Actinobacteria-7]|nr:MAG: YraN family protein [Actinobacteria bacterium HGW-Actinobacteria-7]
MDDARKRLGERGEDAAVAYLERAGFTVVERNWRSTRGEVDVIALDGDTLVLCEVKTRTSKAKGSPDEAVTPAKQRRYGRLAAEYIQQAGLIDVPVRFDVVSILVIAADRALLRHHRAAFVPGDS